MKTEATITETIERLKAIVDAWKESPPGYLVPTEVNASERERIRMRLNTAIDMLYWVLDNE